MAQQLRRMGEEVGLAALIDSIEWHYWQEIKRTVSFPNRLRVYRERFHRAFLEPDGMAYLKDRFGARWRHGVSRVQAIFQGPPALAAKDIEDANIEAANNYYPKPYAGLLTLLRCSERSVLDGGDLLGWENLAAGGIDVHDLPGHHFNITQEPRVRVLGETLKACIEKSLAGGSGVMETARG
jgi:aspartate racemase